jgi:hypothetical protein
MAHLIRSAKSGSDWTQYELRAFNIKIETVDVATFFGKPDLPRPSVRQGILSNEHYPIDGLPDKDDRIFFDLMDQASRMSLGRNRPLVNLRPIFSNCSGTMTSMSLTGVFANGWTCLCPCADAGCLLQPICAWSTEAS